MKFKRILFILAFLLCSFSSFSYAQLNWVKYVYFQNWGGLNDHLSSTEIQDGEATEIQNVIFDTGGALKKRFGYFTIPNEGTQIKVATGSVVAVTGLSFFEENDGTKHLVAVTQNDDAATVMKKTYSGNVLSLTTGWDNIDATTIMPPSPDYDYDDICDFAVAENVLVFTVGLQYKPFKWTGEGNVSLFSSDTDIPNATMVEYHKNQLFLAGDEDNPSRVYFSNLDDIFNFTNTDFFDVETADGSKIRGMISALDSLYIFKDRSVWKLSGWAKDSFILQKVVTGIGSLSQHSIVMVNNLIYFTTEQNDIAVYDGGYDVKFLSQKIRNTIGTLNYTRANKNLGLAFSTYKYADADYYASVSNGGSATHNRVLMFDTAFSAWTVFLGLNPNTWVVADDPSGQNALFFGDADGYVHRYPSTSYFDGNVTTNAISAFYQTKWFRYPEVSLGEKDWRLLKTYAVAQDSETAFLFAEVKADQESSGRILTIDLSPLPGSALWDVALWDVGVWGGVNIVIDRQEIDKGENMFQIRFSNDTDDQGFEILGWEIFIEPNERI